MAKAFLVYLDESENNFLRAEMEKLANRNLEGLTPEEIERSNRAQAIIFDLDNSDVDDGDSDDGEEEDDTGVIFIVESDNPDGEYEDHYKLLRPDKFVYSTSLTREEAEESLELLKKKHPNRNFRINELGSEEEGQQ